jgi:hypothetical protein
MNMLEPFQAMGMVSKQGSFNFESNFVIRCKVLDMYNYVDHVKI